MEFEGNMYPVPKNTNAYLTNLYGDWKKLPTENQIKRAIHNPIYYKDLFGEQE